MFSAFSSPFCCSWCIFLSSKALWSHIKQFPRKALLEFNGTKSSAAKDKDQLGCQPFKSNTEDFFQTNIHQWQKGQSDVMLSELPLSPLTCNIFFLSLYLLSSNGSMRWHETFPSGETCCSCRSRDDKNVTCIKQVNHEQWGQGASGFSPERKQETLRKQQKRALPHRFPGATRANANVPAYHCPYSLLYSHSLVLRWMSGLCFIFFI